jgi:hypothetical protein
MDKTLVGLLAARFPNSGNMSLGYFHTKIWQPAWCGCMYETVPTYFKRTFHQSGITLSAVCGKAFERKMEQFLWLEIQRLQDENIMNW